MAVMNGFPQFLSSIEDDFKKRLKDFHKSRREGIVMLVALMLSVKSVNLNELAAALPRDIGSKDHRYQYIARILANKNIDCDEVMRPYAQEVFKRLSQHGETLVLMMDQSKINDLNEVLMLSVRLGKRAIPVAWRVLETNGNIGFETQKELLDEVRDWLPEGSDALLAADRFYGTAKLIAWCQKTGWGYRIRLKGNLTLQHQGGEISTGEILSLCPEGLENAELYGTGVSTNIGVLHEKGHPEPWIIAMDARPGQYQVLDYGMRWGIEPMFSDFKSRGFGLAKSQIQKPERLERLLLIMSIAMYWAVSCGACDGQKDTGVSVRKGGEKRGNKNA